MEQLKREMELREAERKAQFIANMQQQGFEVVETATGLSFTRRGNDEDEDELEDDIPQQSLPLSVSSSPAPSPFEKKRNTSDSYDVVCSACGTVNVITDADMGKLHLCSRCGREI